MSANLGVSTPTFHSLNAAQKRALVLRDELRFMDTRHLDNFIEGIATDEPPTYRRINGIVQPSLAMVTLKHVATHFDLGNVHFDKDSAVGNGIFRAYLTVENGSLEMRTEQALPADDAIPDSVPIHIFIAKTMVPMYEAKFKAIYARRNQINEIRRVAFNLAKQPLDEFQKGETLSRLDFEQNARHGLSSEAKKAKKRRPGEPVVKHPTNHRKQVGLDVIPQDAKAATFNGIPNQVKVDFFNSVVTTAFPNFDNLMMASWNVVSIYSNVGTDFPELHKSIVELKSVLQDFDEAFSARVKRIDPDFRRDFAVQDDANNAKGRGSTQLIPDARRDIANEPDAVMEGDTSNAPQEQDDHGEHEEQDEDDASDSLFVDAESDDMPPPRLPSRQFSESSDVKPDPSSSYMPSSSPQLLVTSSPNPRKRSRRPSSSPHDQPSPAPSRRREDHQHRHHSSFAAQSPSSSSSFAVQPPSPSHESDSDSVPHHAPPKPKSFSEMNLSELRAAYKTRKAILLEKFGENKNVPAQFRLRMLDMVSEIKRRQEVERKERYGEVKSEDDDGESRMRDVGEDRMRDTGRGRTEGKGEAVPKFLGNSLLGEKKGGGSGMAPVAPMMHMRKESGGGGGDIGGGNGGEMRRGD